MFIIKNLYSLLNSVHKFVFESKCMDVSCKISSPKQKPELCKIYDFDPTSFWHNEEIFFFCRNLKK